MFSPTKWKMIVSLALVVLAVIPYQVKLRLFVAEILSIPLRPLLSPFPQLFFRDKPFINYYGGLLVLLFYAVLVYVIWSIIQRKVGV